MVRFVGYEACDIVPTKWVTVHGVEGDKVAVWYPDCHSNYPKKCLNLVRAAGEPDKATSKIYIVKVLYLTGMLCVN